MAQLHFTSFFHLALQQVTVTLTDIVLMLLNMGGCAIVGIILSLNFVAVSVSVGTTLSSVYSPEDHQGLVERNNTTAKLRGLARQISGLDAPSLSAAFFRNGILRSAQFDTDSSFTLDARAGGCQCSGLSSKW